MTFEETLDEIRRLERVIDGLRRAMAGVLLNSADVSIADADFRSETRQRMMQALTARRS
jgi:hypothetical protein